MAQARDVATGRSVDALTMAVERLADPRAGSWYPDGPTWLLGRLMCFEHNEAQPPRQQIVQSVTRKSVEVDAIERIAAVLLADRQYPAVPRSFRALAVGHNYPPQR